MLHIGLTGGIGSGKTTVANIFNHLGVPIYFSDDRAKAIVQNDTELKSEIVTYFGISLLPDGGVDKKALAQIVFHDKKALEHLNGLIHPKVAKDYVQWSQQYEGDQPYVIKEAAILFESGAAKAMDEVLVVSAPLAIRLDRVMSRDGVDKVSVMRRMENQWTEEQRLDRADHVLINDGKHSILHQVLALHKLWITK